MIFLRAKGFRVLTTAVATLGVASCGGGYGGGDGNYGDPPPGGPPVTYTVGGTVTGLSGSGLKIRSNGAELAIGAAGAFTFPTAIANSTAYDVTVLTQPTNPVQACTVANGSGTVNAANVTNVAITCTTTLSVVSSTPENASLEASRGIAAAVTFNFGLDASTVTSASVSLRGPTGEEPAAVSVSADNTLTVTPEHLLAVKTPYSITVNTSVRGANGAVLTTPYVLTFTTGHWENPKLIDNDVLISITPQIAVAANGNARAVWQQKKGVTQIWSSVYTAADGWGAPEPVETENYFAALSPQIAVDANGNAVAVWLVSALATPAQVWASRFTPGQGWSGPRRVDAGTDEARDPQIAIDSNGEAIVVWSQNDRPNGQLTEQAWANHDSATTGSWSQARIIDDVDRFVIGVRVATDTDGHALAIWQQANGTGLHDIWASYFTTGTWEDPEQVDIDDSGTAETPDVAFDADGIAHAVWKQSDGTRDNIWASRFDPQNGWMRTKLIETDDTGSAKDPRIAVAANGTAIAVWQQAEGTRNNVWANRFDETEDWGTAQVIDRSENSASTPDVAIDATGNAVAVWSQIENGQIVGIYSSRYKANQAWGSVAKISGADRTSSFPHVALDDSGAGLAVWSESNGVLRTGANRFEP